MISWRRAQGPGAVPPGWPGGSPAATSPASLSHPSAAGSSKYRLQPAGARRHHEESTATRSRSGATYPEGRRGRLAARRPQSPQPGASTRSIGGRPSDSTAPQPSSRQPEGPSGAQGSAGRRQRRPADPSTTRLKVQKAAKTYVQPKGSRRSLRRRAVRPLVSKGVVV